MNGSGILQHYRLIEAIRRACDIALILTTWIFCSQVFDLAFNEFSALAILTVCISFTQFAAVTRLYNSQRVLSPMEEQSRLILTLMLAMLSCAGLAYVSFRVFITMPPKALALWTTASLISLSSWRTLIRILLNALRTRGMNHKRAVIVGHGTLADQLRSRLEENLWMGIRVVNLYGADYPSSQNRLSESDMLRLTLQAERGEIDYVYLTLPLEEHATLERLIRSLANSTCSVYFVPDIFTFDLLKSRMHLIEGIPAISIYDSPFTPSDEALKRSFDVCFSLAALLSLAPLLICIGLLVRLTSSGPALFRQTRYGLNGRPFLVWKFRTMTTQDNGSHIQQARKNDPRITRLGRFLRSTSLDELPQFFNVLGGSMSIVGPRPHAAAHNEEYRRLIPGYMLRHKVKPGITGWAQINGWRGETETLDKMESRIQCDLEYMRRWSFALDLRIIVMTIISSLRHENAR